MLLRVMRLLALLYIAADFMDPSIPGVFFFDADQLFIDGAVQAKTSVTHDARPEVTPAMGSGANEDPQPSVAALPRSMRRADRIGHSPRRGLTLDRLQSRGPSSLSEDH